MKLYVLILLVFLTILIEASLSTNLLTSGKHSPYYSSKHSDNLSGLWKSKRKWKYYWVKEWEAKKIFVPVWKKVWTPIDIKEWIPVPTTPHH